MLTLSPPPTVAFLQQNNFAVGTVVAGRDTEEAQSVLGFFVKTLPICFKLQRTMSFKQLLLNTRDTLMESYRNSDVTFDAIVSVCRGAFDGPILECLLIIQQGDAKTGPTWDRDQV